MEPRMAGWREQLNLPGWGIAGLSAKLDTGAKSSCIDARGMDIIEGDEHGHVRFTIPGPDGDVEREEPILDWRLVRDSGGHQSLRPVIAVDMEMAGESWTAHATLHDRSDMQHRVLVGRRSLEGRFFVNPAQAFVVTTAPESSDV